MSILVGAGSISSYDNFGSPLPYSGFTVPVGGQIEYRSRTIQHSVSGFGITSLGNAANLTNEYSKQSGNKAYFAFFDLRYRFTHYISDISKTGIHFSLGAELENMDFARVYDFSGDLREASGSGEASVSAALAANFDYPVNEHDMLAALLSLPVASYVWRPAYGLIQGNSTLFSYPIQTKFEPIGTMWGWRISLDYSRVLSNPLVLRLHLNELYYNFPMLDWRTVGAETDFDIGLTWRL